MDDDERDRLVAEWKADATAAAAAFDKIVSFLAGGALALSITFLHDIAPHPVQEWRLAVAWSALWVALMSSMASFLTSDGAFRRLIAHAEEGQELTIGRLGEWTRYLNWASAAGVVLGTGFLAYFAFGNLPTGGAT